MHGETMAHVAAAQGDAEQGFDGENDPSEGDDARTAWLAAGETEGKNKQDEDHVEGRLQLACAGRAAGVRVHGRIDGGAGREVEEERDGEQNEKADCLC